MRYWKITASIRQKSGSYRRETYFAALEEPPEDVVAFEEVDRLPEYGESWIDGAWVRDEVLAVAHADEARWRDMPRAQLVAELRREVTAEIAETIRPLEEAVVAQR
jgi:hypothetical protein